MQITAILHLAHAMVIRLFHVEILMEMAVLRAVELVHVRMAVRTTDAFQQCAQTIMIAGTDILVILACAAPLEPFPMPMGVLVFPMGTVLFQSIMTFG